LKASEWLSQDKLSTKRNEVRTVSEELLEEIKDKAEATINTLPKSMRPEKVYEKVRPDIIQGLTSISLLAISAHDAAKERGFDASHDIEQMDKILRPALGIIMEFVATWERAYRKKTR